MKNISVLLPDKIDENEFKRKAYFLLEYFGNHFSITFYIENESSQNLVERYLRKRAFIKKFISELPSDDILVFYKSELTNNFHKYYLNFLPGQSSRDVYTIETDGRLRRSAMALTNRDLPTVDAHIFNQLGPKSPDGEFYFFPFNYLFKYPGLGPINSFGFRVPEDYSKLKTRPKTHKLLIFFGGSAVWSMYSYIHEMFTSVLERLLNQYCESHNIDLSFNVLNFGMHGHVVSNELSAYIMFCQELNPDYVIAHDGWNDFIYGMLSDKTLLNKHSMIYQYNLEYWSQILHNTSEIKATQKPNAFRIVNLPHNIIAAYLHRKNSFQQIVQQSGCQFLWALQPSIYSKKVHSSKETVYLQKELDYVNPFRLPYKRMPFIYQRFVNMVSGDFPVSVLDLHTYFNKFGNEETLFGDIIHTTPEGDCRIAEFYLAYFKRVIKEDMVCSRESSKLL